MYNYLSEENIKHFIQSALEEDVGPGDFTSLATIPSNAEGKAKLLVKEEGVLAGLELALHIFKEDRKSVV